MTTICRPTTLGRLLDHGIGEYSFPAEPIEFLLIHPEIHVDTHIQPLDIIAMADQESLSRRIQKECGGHIGHIAIVTRVLAKDVQIIEATWPRVRYSWLSERIQDYAKSDRGRIWWLSLSPEFRETLDESAALYWLYQQIGKKYGWRQAWTSAMSWAWWLPGLDVESFVRLHCSELAIGGFKAGHGEGFENWNASEANPQDVIQAAIYRLAVNLVWDPTFRGFNEMPPALMASSVNSDK